MRFHLPGSLMVLTFMTLTPKISSTAFLISILPASAATSKVYLLFWVPIMERSVMIGFLIIS